MILLSSNNQVGINPFFPIFITERYKKISAVDWKHYQKLLPFFVIINSFFSASFAYLYQIQFPNPPEVLYSVLNLCVLLYVVIRLKYGKRMIVIETGEKMKTTVAPMVVWLDYISIGSMFFLLASVGLSRTDSTLMYILFTIMRVFFLAYSFLPILNYIKYKHKK
jgi:hypothetical protein